jgi:F-type H+-transporting ATPase subunit a
MMKLLLLASILFSPSAFAAGGFTWLGLVAHQFNIPEHIVSFLFIGLLLLIVGLIYRAKLAKAANPVIPDRGITFRNMVELYGQFMYTQCTAVIGEKEGPKYFKFVSVLFILIFLSNIIGLIPGFLPPTEQINTTFALGVFAFVYYNIKGCKELGVVNYIKHFAGPIWYMAILIFPLEIIANLVRPLSLGLRLQGNIMGDHLVLGVFSGLAPYIVPIPVYILGILVCTIQAYVFTMLSMVYISLATAHHGDHDDHAHQH